MPMPPELQAKLDALPPKLKAEVIAQALYRRLERNGLTRPDGSLTRNPALLKRRWSDLR